MHIIDNEGLIKHVTNLWIEKLGHSREEVINQPWVNFITPKFQEQARQALNQLLETGKGCNDVQYQLLTKSGKSIDVLLSANTIQDDTGNFIHAVIVIKDISEERQKEIEKQELQKRLSLALHASKVGVWEWNLKTNELFWDHQMLELFGISQEQFEGQLDDWLRRIHPDDLETFKKELQKSTSKPNNLDSQFRVILPSEEMKNLKALAQLTYDYEHDCEKLVGVSWDITKNVSATRELKEAKEEAEKATEIKSQFLANMSHEIRTPMNGVLGTVDLLELSELSNEQRKMINTIKRCGKNLMVILNDILDLSRIQAGKLQIERTAFNLQKVLLDIRALFLSSAQDKNLDFIIETSNNLPANLVGDPTRIKQIISNLVSNALKFTLSGNITIKTELTIEAGDFCEIMISVTDTGVGLNQKQAENFLFHDFTQADASTTRQFGGTGLGLSISKGLCELMNGDIKYIPNQGPGSTFAVTLPFKVLGPTSKSVSGRETKIPEGASGNNRSLKVLLVEDNLINQKVAVAFLAKNHLIADTANNGAEALVLATENDYDLILMDIQMPVMDGIKATEEILALKGDKTPIIYALTANVFKEDVKKYLEVGMKGVIPKPLTMNKFKQVLDEVYEMIAQTSSI